MHMTQRTYTSSRIWSTLWLAVILAVTVAACDSGSSDSGGDDNGPPDTPPPQSDVRLNEINMEEQWVELFNAGDGAADVSDLWLCIRPLYVQIGNLDVLNGASDATIPAGGFLVVEWGQIDGDIGELGLYETSDFEATSAMRDYVQIGAADQGRESVAVQAGLWDDDTFTIVPPSGQTLSFFGEGDTTAEEWGPGQPTPAGENTEPPA